MDKENSIVEFLNSEDPLSDSAIDFVIKYKEEDDYIDYKLTLDPSSEKQWLELTKDISAFANTYGGYLVFGVKNDTKEPVGLDDTLCKILADVNNIQQKINRFLDPKIINIRSKQKEFEGKTIVTVYIPQSTTVTHLISKDGEFKHQSGRSNIPLRKGTFYVRRSAGNQLGDSRDLDQIITRRIGYYRETLMNQIARIVEAPTESEIFVVTKDNGGEEGRRFIIHDGPDSIPVKGMSFSVVPKGLEEQIAAWTVISPGNPRTIPSTELLWHWYKKKEELQITNQQRLALAQFSMWANAPIFFWLKGLIAQDIEETIWYSLQHRPAKWQLRSFFTVASFLRKGFYNKVLGVLGKNKDKLPTALQSYPKLGMKKAFCRCKPSGNKSIEDHLKDLEEELNSIVNSVDGVKVFQPSALQRFRALQLDCYLFAPDDKYE